MYSGQDLDVCINRRVTRRRRCLTRLEPDAGGSKVGTQQPVYLALDRKMPQKENTKYKLPRGL